MSSQPMNVDASYNKPNAATIAELKNVANRIRISSLKQTTRAGSGHPTTETSTKTLVFY